MKTAPEGFKGKLKRWWKKEIRPALIMAAVLFAVRSSLADWNDVPTGSMKPTILEGDRVYVNKLAYDLKIPFTTVHLAEWDNPHRGEIVVFYSPHDGQRLVKRVIGLPGDTIELRDNTLLLNGEAINYGPVKAESLRDVSPSDTETLRFAAEELPNHTHPVATWPEVAAKRNFGPVTVPEGKYFMMGDNRDNSFDSRYFGFVERKRILGQATAVVISLDREHHWKPRGDRLFSKLP
jgi:signal peptidase I